MQYQIQVRLKKLWVTLAIVFENADDAREYGRALKDVANANWQLVPYAPAPVYVPLAAREAWR